MRMITISILALTISTSACVVTNVNSSKAIEPINSVQQARSIIRPGMSMDQVKARLGAPTNSATFNSQTIWNYNSVKADFSGRNGIIAGLGGPVLPDTKTVSVTFGSSGKVRRVDFSQTKIAN